MSNSQLGKGNASKEQIDRLLKPGAAYFNLNPFEVLQITPETSLEEMKKQYRKLSILVHPDKNPDDPRSQDAFDIISKAYQALQDPDYLSFCQNVVEEAKKRLAEELKAKKKKAKKEGTTMTEQEESLYQERSLRDLTCKLFVEMEKKKQKLEEREAAERKRKREKELEEIEKKKREAEWQAKWEEQRDDRVNSWRNFISGKKQKTGKSSSNPSLRKTKTALRPPPLSTESRPATSV